MTMSNPAIDLKYPIEQLPIGLSESDRQTLVTYELDHQRPMIAEDVLQYIVRAEEIQFGRQCFYNLLKTTEHVFEGQSQSLSARVYFFQKSQAFLETIRTHQNKLIEARDGIQAEIRLNPTPALDLILQKMAIQIQLIRTLTTLIGQYQALIELQTEPESFLIVLRDLISVIQVS